jgi:hypothetical protein
VAVLRPSFPLVPCLKVMEVVSFNRRFTPSQTFGDCNEICQEANQRYGIQDKKFLSFGKAFQV